MLLTRATTRMLLVGFSLSVLLGLGSLNCITAPLGAPNAVEEHRLVSVASSATVRQLTWNPTSSALAVIVSYEKAERQAKLGQRLAVVRLSGRIDFLTKGHWDGLPRWSPDGRKIAFTRVIEKPSLRELRLLSRPWRDLKADEKHEVHKANMKLIDTDICVIELDEQNVVNVTKQSRQDSGYERFLLPDWSPDASTISALVYKLERYGLWLKPLERLPGDSIVLLAPEQLVGIGRYAWAPDGDTIAAPAAEWPSCATSLYTVNLRTGNWRRITQIAAIPLDQHLFWSQDSRRVIFASRTLRGVDFWNAEVAQARVDLAFQAHIPEGYEFHDYSWKRDGKQVAIIGFSNTASGTPNDAVFVLSVTQTQPKRVFSGGRLTSVRWSPDGKTIAFVQNGNVVHFLQMHE